MRNFRVCCVWLALSVLPLGAQAGGDSDVDSEFGTSGFRRVAFDLGGGNTDYALALVAEPSGNFVIAGNVELPSSSTGNIVGIARIQRSTGNLLASYTMDANLNSVTALAVDSAGRPVVVGRSPANNDGMLDLGVVRFLSNGNPDTSFSSDGMLAYDSTNSIARDEPLAVVTRSNGDIIVLVEEYLNTGAAHPFVLVSIPANGQNPGTMALGPTTTGLGGGAMRLQADGKLLVAVNVDINGSGCLRPRLFRFAANTLVNLDSDFGNAGSVTLVPPGGTGCAPYVTSMALDAGGRIVLGAVANAVSSSASWIARVTASGTLDTSFDSDGWMRLPRPINGSYHDVYGVGVQADGAILAGGTFTHDNASIGERPILSRVLPDGSADTSFNPATPSQVYTLGSNVLQQNARALLMDGDRAVLAGIHLATAPQDYDFQIFRSKGTLPRHGFE